MLLQHPFGLRLGDEQQEGVGRVVNAYVTKLEVRCRASSYEGRDLERAPPERHELVGDAHLLQKLERTGVNHESAAPPRLPIHPSRSAIARSWSSPSFLA